MTRLVTVLLSLYITTFLYIELPFVKGLNFAGTTAKGLFVSHAAVFVALFIFLEVILSRHVFAKESFGAKRNILLGLLTIGILGFIIAILYHIVPATSLYAFPKIFNTLFASNTAFVAWLIAPLILLFF